MLVVVLDMEPVSNEEEEDESTAENSAPKSDDATQDRVKVAIGEEGVNGLEDGDHEVFTSDIFHAVI